MNLVIDRTENTPIYRQIVRQIRELIRQGRLPSGFHLPPERRLAESLGVTRTTVITAYDELKADGLVDARVGRGTVVSGPRFSRPANGPVRPVPWERLFRDEGWNPPDRLLRDLLELSEREDVISFAIGLPYPDLIPVDLFTQTLARLAVEAGPAMLLHSPTEGHTPLREAIARWLTSRGILCDPEEVLVLSGSQQGLHLAAKVFLDPGDEVVVEAPTYFGAMEAFKRAEVRLIPAPVDAEGLRVDYLADILERRRPKLIYTLPTFQNPSGLELSLERRRRLVELAAVHGVPILEDDPYSELRYEGDPLPSLKALDSSGLVLYLGTFSKILFPGLRLGWLAAPRTAIRRFALAKQSEDLHSNTPGQYVLEKILSENHLEPHLKRLRAAYRIHRDAMAAALRAEKIEGLTWALPRGGFYFWCTLPRDTDRRRLLQKIAEKALAVLPGDPCFTEETADSYIRLNFTYLPPDRIREGVQRLAEAFAESREARGTRPHPRATLPIV